MFVGREKELNKLSEMYASNKFEFAVIYGRRRIGKTTLITEFCKQKKAIYFMAREANENINLQNFSADVFNVTDPKSVNALTINSWETAFDYIYRKAQDERLVLVIDEFPYLAESYKPISSILQAAIDHKFLNSKLFLILCGSSMSFMEYQVLGYKSPLFGRRTAQFKIRPFSYFEALPFFKSASPEEKAIFYGITGGIPEYMVKINSAISPSKNIINLYLTDSGHLFEEPGNLIKQELREPSTYNGIIEAIACGASKLNEIATKTGMESNKCAKYLTSLMTLGIVKKDIPITEDSSKRSIYLLTDQMFRFWYRFVFSNMSLIISNKGESLYYHKIEPQLNSYMGLVFEEICKDYLMLDDVFSSSPFFYGKIGRWWGTNPLKKRQEEIDIMAYDGNSAIFGECKWINSLVNMDVLHDLMEQGNMFSYSNKWYYLFAKNGFSDELKAYAKTDAHITLITFDEMNARDCL